MAIKKAVLLTISIVLILLSYGFTQTIDTSTVKKDSTEAIESLDKLIITATKTNRLMSETPASVSVLTKEEIDVSPAKNVDDLIMSETGVQVKRVVGIGEGIPSDIIIRGISGSLGSSRTLILVDGIPTNASGTPFLILNEIPLGAINTIEVVRGPYSSLYGANAFGGAVNVRTIEGQGKPKLTSSIETSYPFTVGHKTFANKKDFSTALSEAGTDAYWNIEGTSSGGNDRFHYLASAGFRTIGNYLLHDSATTKRDSTLIYKKNENYDYRDTRFFGKCGYHVNDALSLELHGRFFDSELGFGKTKKIKPDSVDIVTKGRKFVIGPLARLTLSENVDMTIRTHYRTLIGEFWNEEKLPDDSYSPGYWKSQSHDWQIESQAIIQAGKSQVITCGLDILGNAIHFGEKTNPQTGSQIPATYAVDASISNIALFAQDEITLKKLIIIPGARIDYHSDFGSALSPKLGISYKLFDWMRIRNSVGRAFRAPTLSELYMPDLRIRSDLNLKPNPNLKPEFMRAIDGGIDLFPTSTLRLQIGGFLNQMKDLIGQTVVISDSSVTHANISDAWSRGLEVDFEWQWTDWLNVFVNYVFQKTKNESASAIRKMFQRAKNLRGYELHVSLDYVPSQTADIGFRLLKKLGNSTLEGTLTQFFVGRRQYQEWTEIVYKRDVMSIPEGNIIKVYIDPPLIALDAHWRTDMSIKWTSHKLLWAALNIQNVFNAEYEEHGGTLSPGRFASLRIGINL